LFIYWKKKKSYALVTLPIFLGMSIPAVSQHLRKLKDGNIVEARKEGQTIYYSLTQENIKIFEAFL